MARLVVRTVMLPPVHQALEVALGEGPEPGRQDRVAAPATSHRRAEHELSKQAPELEPARGLLVLLLSDGPDGVVAHLRLLLPQPERRLEPGTASYIAGESGIHKIQNKGLSGAISLHLCAPKVFESEIFAENAFAFDGGVIRSLP